MDPWRATKTMNQQPQLNKLNHQISLTSQSHQQSNQYSTTTATIENTENQQQQQTQLLIATNKGTKTNKIIIGQRNTPEKNLTNQIRTLN